MTTTPEPTPTTLSDDALPTTEWGRLAWTFYANAVDWRSYDGKPLPSYDDLGPAIQSAWKTTAERIAEIATTGTTRLL